MHIICTYRQKAPSGITTGGDTLSRPDALPIYEPTNYEEAMVGPDSNKWLESMKSEMGSMYENKVWTLTDLPDDW